MHKTRKGLSAKNIILLWVLGLAGQLCWNLENQWFNLYTTSYFGYDMGTIIVTLMVIFSAAATCFSTFLFGTLSDRIGKRKVFVGYGYIIWGIFTFLFGITHKLKGTLAELPWLMITIVVLADTIMSFFGSMGNDSGFNAWTTDILNDDTKGPIGIAIAAQPVVGTIAGTLLGGAVIASSLGYTGFFAIMGAMISIIGVVALLIMKDEPTLQPKVDGSYWHQFASAFNFKKFIANKELVLTFIIIAVYFIGFNCFFSYIANIFVDNFLFNVDDFSVVEGVSLLLSIVLMIVSTMKVKKDRSPLFTLIAIVSSVVGLLILTVVSRSGLFDNANLYSAINIPLILGIILVGYGYVLFMQTTMVWAKSLYPEEQRGQYEGVRIIFFVLIPMIFGSLFSKFFITNFGKPMPNKETGVMENVPNEILFVAAIVIMLISIVPLFFVNKLHKQRVEA